MRIISLLLLLTSVALGEQLPPGTEIKIGVIAPLSGSMAVYGEPPRKLFQLLQPILNRESKRMFRYRFIYEDGQCGVGNHAAVAARKLISVDRVNFLITACSGETLQVSPIAERERIVTIAIASGHPDIQHAGEYIFRTYINLEQGVELIARAIAQDSRSRVAMLTETTSFTQSIQEVIQKKLGSRLVTTEEFPVDETDFRAILQRIRRNRPDAYYLNTAAPASYQRLFHQLHKGAAVYGYFNPGEGSTLRNLGEAQNGVVYFDVPEIESKHPWFKQVRSELAAGDYSEFLLQTAHDAVAVIFQALERRGDISAVLSELYTGTFQGVTGEIRFNRDGEIQGLSYVLKEIVAGRGRVREVN